MKCRRCTVLLDVALGLTFLFVRPVVAENKEFLLYAGTYTGFKYISHGNPVSGSHSEGIYVSRFRPATGELTEAQLAAKMSNPSFLAVSPNQRFLYAVSEDPLSVGPARDHESFVSAYAIDRKTGKLRLLNSVPSGGTSTCYLSVDKTGKYVLTASSGSGSISILRVHKDGSLGQQSAFVQHIGHSGNQTQAHPSSNDVSPDNRFVSVADLGLDKVLIYRFDPDRGSLSPLEPAFAPLPAGSGPRHFIFDAAAKYAYLMNELTDVVSVFAWDSVQGTLTGLQDVSTELPVMSAATTRRRLRYLRTVNFSINQIAVFARMMSEAPIPLEYSRSIQRRAL